ncbi:hypothetical protein EON66_02385, partial [archaeon]
MQDEWVRAIETMLLPANAPSRDAPAAPWSSPRPRPVSVDSHKTASVASSNAGSSSVGIFGMLGRDKERPSSAGSASSSIITGAQDAAASSAPTREVTVLEAQTLLGFKRDAATGVMHLPEA